MPGFDGTGPCGMGPMTGRGMGYCAVPLPGALTGSGRRTVYPTHGAPFYHQMSREQEFEFLMREAETLREQLKELEERIGQLSTGKDKEAR